MIAIFPGAQLAMSPIAGKWAGMYGRRVMIIAGPSGLALSMIVFLLLRLNHGIVCVTKGHSCSHNVNFKISRRGARICHGHEQCLHEYRERFRPITCGGLFDILIIYPFVLGLIVLVLTTIGSARWKTPKKALT